MVGKRTRGNAVCFASFLWHARVAQAGRETMLEISQDTYSRMSDVEEDKYIMRVVDFLRAQVPSLSSESPEAMYAQVRLLKEQAASHDLFSEQAVAVFAMTAA